jgi:hypothetical protein
MQEKGWPGAVIDVGGSADVGVFQFNTSGSNWIPVLNEKFGFSESDLRDYISVSTFSAAYVLSEEYQRTGSWMEAAGNYHRHKKDSARSRYQISVASHIKNFIKQDSRYSNLLANKALSKLAKKSLEERTAGVNFK